MRLCCRPPSFRRGSKSLCLRYKNLDQCDWAGSTGLHVLHSQQHACPLEYCSPQCRTGTPVSTQRNRPDGKPPSNMLTRFSHATLLPASIIPPRIKKLVPAIQEPRSMRLGRFHRLTCVAQPAVRVPARELLAAVSNSHAGLNAEKSP